MKLNQWDIKFLREQPFMAFGSLMNAYAQMHQQKPVDLEEFLASADKIFAKAQELANKSLQENLPTQNDVDFPVKE